MTVFNWYSLRRPLVAPKDTLECSIFLVHEELPVHLLDIAREHILMGAISEKDVQQVVLDFRPCVQRIVQ